jgi:hypothetical protein
MSVLQTGQYRARYAGAGASAGDGRRVYFRGRFLKLDAARLAAF